MYRSITASLVFSVLLVNTAFGSTEPPSPRDLKAATVGSRLLLPIFIVDTIDPEGTTTLFAVRNQSTYNQTIDIKYFRTDQPQAPQRTDVVVLAAKSIETINIAFVSGLHIDEAGLACGYVTIETQGGATTIYGDYFLVTPNEDFANGFRLVNIDPSSNHNELCNRFAVRFLNGGGFDSATRFLIWRDLDVPPTLGETAFWVSVYNEAGEQLLVQDFASDQTTLDVTTNEILQGMVSADFGALEFEFAMGAVGHISAVMSASGRYSVGLEATCLDNR